MERQPLRPDSGDLVMEGGVKIASQKTSTNYATNILGNILRRFKRVKKGNWFESLRRIRLRHRSRILLAILVDRENKSVLIMASTEGGMDIEHVAETTPEKIHKISVDPNAGLMGYQKRDLGLALGLSGEPKAFAKA